MPPKSKAPAAKKSCITCPASMSVHEQNKGLGRDFGSRICGLKMLMIDRPGVTNSHPEKQAEKCDSHGHSLNIKPEARHQPIVINVGMPYFRSPDEPDIDEAEAKKVLACNGCRFYMDRSETKAKLGWESGYCRAKGQLILDDRLWQYAKDCDEKEIKSVRDDYLDNSEIKLFPEFTEEFGRLSAAALIKVLRKGTEEDPRTAQPDKEASDKARALNIRGWRKVRDQKGRGPDIFLPMFSYDGYEERLRSAIPTNKDPEEPHLYLDHGNYVYRVAVMWARLKETPAVWGPAGVGKTELFRHMAWLMTSPFTRVSITESSEIDDIAGKMMYSPAKGTYFHYGRVPQAWQQPNVLCVDEPNTGPPAVWQFFRPMTDNSKQLVLDQNEGERITAHQFCYLGMAMNPSWDPRNVGTQIIGDADGSRLMHISMALPPVELEAEIIGRRLQSDRWEPHAISEVVDTVMRIAPDIRDLSLNGQIDTSWGIRHQIKVARAKRYFSWTDAYLMGVADSLEPGQAQAILDVVRSHTTDED